MKGFVTKLCDIDSIEIPEEMLDIRVDEQQVEAELAALPLRYAKEEIAEVAGQGDTVFCRADPQSYPDGRTILLYPAVPLPGAEEAVKQAVGKRKGDTFSVQLAGKTAVLTVEKVLRRTPVEVNDALIAQMGIDGVATVNDYRNYYRNKLLADLKMEKGKEVTFYILEQMEAGCTFEYDRQEMNAFVQKSLEEYLRESQEMGIDEPLDEVKAAIVAQEKQNWMAEAFCKSRGIEVNTEEAEAQADQMLEMMQLTGEPVPDRAELVEMGLQSAYFEGVIRYIDEILEKKMGGSHGNA